MEIAEKHNNSFYDYELSEGPMAENIHTEMLITFSTVTALSLVGNILVVVICSVLWIKLRSLTCVFILNLALSDLLFTVGPLLWVYDHIWGLAFGDALCKIASFIGATGFYSCIVFLVLMSVWRYMVVVRLHSGWKKGRRFTLVLISAWMVSIFAALPIMVHTVANPYLKGCLLSSETAMIAIMYEHNIVFAVAILFGAFCYIRILQTILKSPRNQTHRTTGLAFLLLATVFICFAPYNVMISLICHKTEISTHQSFHYALYICHLLAFSRCCSNPVIYGLFGVKFRKTVREILQRRANFSSAQTRMVELHSGSCVKLNDQVPDLDVNHDVSDL